MAFELEGRYAPDVEERVCAFYETLSEKDQRRYAAVEARRLGFGGIGYLADLLGCSRKTIERGLAELEELPNDPAAGRIRRPGGGRKKSRVGATARTESEVGAGGSHRRRSGR